GLRRVHVPLDGTALTLMDKKRAKGLGPVGERDGAQGVHVMTAFVVSSEGTTLGIAGQRTWVRKASKAKSNDPVESETDHWLKLLINTHREFEEQSPDCEAFYQLDRGADCGAVLSLAVEAGLLLTVRAAHDRKVDTEAGRLWKEVSGAPPHLETWSLPSRRHSAAIGARDLQVGDYSRRRGVQSNAPDVPCETRARSPGAGRIQQIRTRSPDRPPGTEEHPTRRCRYP